MYLFVYLRKREIVSCLTNLANVNAMFANRTETEINYHHKSGAVINRALINSVYFCVHSSF